MFIDLTLFSFQVGALWQSSFLSVSTLYKEWWITLFFLEECRLSQAYKRALVCMCEWVLMGNSSLKDLKLYKLGLPQLLGLLNL